MCAKDVYGTNKKQSEGTQLRSSVLCFPNCILKVRILTFFRASKYFYYHCRKKAMSTCTFGLNSRAWPRKRRNCGFGSWRWSTRLCNEHTPYCKNRSEEHWMQNEKLRSKWLILHENKGLLLYGGFHFYLLLCFMFAGQDKTRLGADGGCRVSVSSQPMVCWRNHYYRFVSSPLISLREIQREFLMGKLQN